MFEKCLSGLTIIGIIFLIFIYNSTNVFAQIDQEGLVLPDSFLILPDSCLVPPDSFYSNNLTIEYNNSMYDQGLGFYRIKADSLFKQIPNVWLVHYPDGNFPSYWRFIGTINFAEKKLIREEITTREWQ